MVVHITIEMVLRTLRLLYFIICTTKIIAIREYHSHWDAPFFDSLLCCRSGPFFSPGPQRGDMFFVGH